MRDWEERSWSEGIDPWDVIAQVGKKLVARYLSSSQAGDSLLLLAGPGAQRGRCPRHGSMVVSATRRTALREWKTRRPDTPRDPPGPRAGYGDRRAFWYWAQPPLEGVWASIVEVLESILRPLDIGGCAKRFCVNGRWYHRSVVQARETWTIGALKETLLKTHAGAVTGRLVLLKDVGLNALEPRLSELHAYDPHDAVGFPPPRPAHAHKGSQGWWASLGVGLAIMVRLSWLLGELPRPSRA